MKRFGVMVDLSRNATKSIKTLKEYIDVLKKMRMNTLYLYMEDILTLEGEPYFGYLRGRYSIKELQELDEYGFKNGIEVVPCIQTLAHLNQIFRWKPYMAINDITDTLLCDDDKTYQLINKMFDFVSKAFKTRSINIGMDEAFFLGRGKYLSLHGHKNKVQIFFRHLSKVYEMASNYSFKVAIWSDMIYRSVAHSEEYYNTKLHFDLSTIPSFPKEISLIYWDYYHDDKKTYDKMFESHLEFPNKIGFAAGAWSWAGFVPLLKKALNTLKPGIISAKEHNIEEVMITLWGDNGAECPLYATLAPLFYASELYYGNTSLTDIKEKFYKTFGIAYNDFMKLEIPNNTPNSKDPFDNPSKYLFYNDPFLGVCDCTIAGGENAYYSKCSKTLNSLSKRMKEYSYVPAMYASLSKVLSYKAELGVLTRKAYKENDINKLNELLPLYSQSIKAIKAFLNAFRIAWYKENKPFGFEIHEIRIGGLIQRMESCQNRLKQYINKEIDKIEELEEDILDVNGDVDAKRIATNINDHLFNASTNRF